MPPSSIRFIIREREENREEIMPLVYINEALLAIILFGRAKHCFLYGGQGTMR